MRAVALAALATSLFSAAALAADFDPGPLRGTQYAEPVAAPVTLWEGPYFGGFGGASQSNFQTRHNAEAIITPVLKNTAFQDDLSISSWLNTPLTKNPRGSAYGGFAGYNWQFEDVVFGFEADYTHTGLKDKGFDAFEIVNNPVLGSDGYYNIGRFSRSALTTVKDLATLRARAGYTAGAFMPFVTGG